MVWTAQLSPGLGHEIVAVLAVLAAFFGGLALGAWLLGPRVARSILPGRVYARCEALIAVWGVGSVVLLPTLTPLWSALLGAEPAPAWHWTVAFTLPFVLLLPATAAMGVTLPALERQLRGDGHQLGGLYAANTAGALIGVLLTVFVLLPRLGVQATGWLCVAANALCAAGAWWLWGHPTNAEREQTVSTVSYASSAPSASSTAAAAAVRVVSATRATGVASWVGQPRLLALLLASGALGIGYEVLAVRLLSQVTENTVYSYALLLVVYLVGTALGAAIYQRHLQRVAPDRLRLALLTALPAAMLLCGLLCPLLALRFADVPGTWPALRPAPWLDEAGIQATTQATTQAAIQAATALLGEVLAGGAVLLLPAALMGVLFGHLCVSAQAQGLALGHALALNTLGAAAAPLLVGVWLLPTVGAQAVVLLLALGYLVLQADVRWRHWGVGGWLAAAALVAGWAPPLRFVDTAVGSRVLSYRDGVMASVSVVEDDEGVARLHINNRQQEGTSAAGLIELRLAQLPLLLHGDARRALFLGLGTGYTANAAARAGLQIDAVELLPEVIAASSHFLGGAPRPPTLHLINADARRYVLASTTRYDLINADLFHPARSGAGSLYTVEHFAAVRARLAPGGLFCQWLALHQMDLATLRGIVAAYLQVYPDAVAVLASNSLDTPVIGLVARPDLPRWDVADVRSSLAGHEASHASGQVSASHASGQMSASHASGQVSASHAYALAQLDDEYAVLGSVLAGPASLARFAAGAVANTDDRPRVMHEAPWSTYAPQQPPRQRLLDLLQALAPTANDVLVDGHGKEAQRLQAYWHARQRYIELGARTPPDADAQRMLRRVQAPLLDVLRISPDFRPAYAPLLALAQAVAASDPARARALLLTLQAIQPARTEAAEALRQLP